MQRPRILIAEDDPLTAALLADILEMHGCEHVTVHNGEHALDALERMRFDLVLLDVMIPGLDGLGVVAEMRRRPATAQTPVVVVSARGGGESIWDGLRAGCDWYITKPFDPAEVIAACDRLLARSAA